MENNQSELNVDKNTDNMIDIPTIETTIEESNNITNQYYLIDLKNKKSPFLPMPDSCYFRLVSDVFREKRFITYSSLLRDYDNYVIKLIDYLLDKLSEKEKDLIIKRYGLNGSPPKTLEELGKDYNLSRERIRQITDKALRKLHHPLNSRYLINLFYQKTDNSSDVCDINYSKYINELIKDEINAFTHDEINSDNLLSKKIIESHRFRLMNYCGTDDIDTLGLSLRSTNLLKRENIKTLDDLANLSEAELSSISDLGRKSYDEIMESIHFLKICKKDKLLTDESEDSIDNLDTSSKTYYHLRRLGIEKISELLIMPENKLFERRTPPTVVSNIKQIIMDYKQANNNFEILFTKKQMKKYGLSVSNLFENDKEIPITDTKIPINDIIDLIRRGFWFVSDFLDYYDYFVNYQDEYNSITIDAPDYLSILRQYSEPFLWIRIPQNIKKAMEKRNVECFSDLEKTLNEFPPGYREEICDIYHDISNAYAYVK